MLKTGTPRFRGERITAWTWAHSDSQHSVFDAKKNKVSVSNAKSPFGWYWLWSLHSLNLASLDGIMLQLVHIGSPWTNTIEFQKRFAGPGFHVWVHVTDELGTGGSVVEGGVALILTKILHYHVQSQQVMFLASSMKMLQSPGWGHCCWPCWLSWPTVVFEHFGASHG